MRVIIHWKGVFELWYLLFCYWLPGTILLVRNVQHIIKCYFFIYFLSTMLLSFLCCIPYYLILFLLVIPFEVPLKTIVPFVKETSKTTLASSWAWLTLLILWNTSYLNLHSCGLNTLQTFGLLNCSLQCLSTSSFLIEKFPLLQSVTWLEPAGKFHFACMLAITQHYAPWFSSFPQASHSQNGVQEQFF